MLQVYVSSKNKETDRPVKLLKGFKRVSVNKGEKIAAEIKVEIEDIRFYNPETGEWILDDEYEIFVGNSSDNIVSVGVIDFTAK